MTTDKIYQVRLSGFGGQGVVLASRILGDALSREGYNVLQTQTYGIEARGGASCGEVLYGYGEINNLRVVAPDILLALSQRALEEYVKGVQQGGFVFYDSYMIKRDIEDKNLHIFGVPFTDIALSEMGGDIYTNLIALGFINGIVKMVSPENLKEAVSEQIKANRENNLKALQRGCQEAGKAALVR